MNSIARLARTQRLPLLGGIAKWILGTNGIEIPKSVAVPLTTKFPHRGFGSVIHPHTVLGDHVTIYQRVLIGRQDSWIQRPVSAKVFVGDHAVLCPGAVILFRDVDVIVAPGTIIGANSVLTQSTGVGEIWAGAPARRVGYRQEYSERRGE